MATTPESRALAKDLKRRGWSFVGPTTVYAFMQAMGLVNDHVEGCEARTRGEEARRRSAHADDLGQLRRVHGAVINRRSLLLSTPLSGDSMCKQPTDPRPQVYNQNVSWPWIALLVAAAVVAVAAEWPRVVRRSARCEARRERARRKANLRLVPGETDEKEEFAASVQRDLDRCRRSRSASPAAAAICSRLGSQITG